MFPRRYSYAWYFEDGIANMVNSLFWLILFGIFGKMYLPEDCEGASGCQSMKAAVWFDMLGMIFWFSSAVGKYHFFSSSSYNILTFIPRWCVHVLERTTQ